MVRWSWTEKRIDVRTSSEDWTQGKGKDEKFLNSRCKHKKFILIKCRERTNYGKSPKGQLSFIFGHGGFIRKC